MNTDHIIHDLTKLLKNAKIAWCNARDTDFIPRGVVENIIMGYKAGRTDERCSTLSGAYPIFDWDQTESAVYNNLGMRPIKSNDKIFKTTK